FLVPIVGKFHLRLFVAGCGQEDQGEAALLIVQTGNLPKAEMFEEADRLLRIGDADHRVQIFHGYSLSSLAAAVLSGWYSNQHSTPRRSLRFKLRDGHPRRVGRAATLVQGDRALPVAARDIGLALFEGDIAL